MKDASVFVTNYIPNLTLRRPPFGLFGVAQGALGLINNAEYKITNDPVK